MSFSLLVDPLGSCLAPVNNLPPMLRQETLLRFSASHTGRHENRTGTHCKGGTGYKTGNGGRENDSSSLYKCLKL